MTTKFCRTLSCMIALLLTHLTYAQKVPPDLRQQLAGKTNLDDIMNIVDSYYDHGRSSRLNRNNEGEEFENEYIHWKRFEQFHASRLDANGNIRFDITRKIWEGMEAYKTAKPEFFRPGSTTNASYGSWSNYGPTTVVRYGEGYNSGYGRVNCMAFDPNDEATLYIGLPQAGIWKSTDNGTNWAVLTDDLPSCGISGLVVSHDNSNVIYALTGDGDASHGGYVRGYGYLQESVGVLKSIDGGINWTRTGVFPFITTSYYGYKLIQHPTNASILLAATTEGIYRTLNGGASWTREHQGIFTDIEYKPGSPSTLYAVRRMIEDATTNANPFYYSLDGGSSWNNNVTTGLPTNAQRLAIGVSAANPNYVYLITGPSTGVGSFKGIYRSTNSGVSFTLRTTTPNILGYPVLGNDNQDQAMYDLCIVVDPNDADEIITGGINIWRSTDGGVTMVNETYWEDDIAGPAEYVHADVHNLFYHPNNINKIFACTDGGVGLSLNDGVDWSFPSSDLHVMATYHADWYEAGGGILANGTQDNGTNVKYGLGNAYRHIYGADGYDCLIDQNDPSDIVFVANGSVIRTLDGGLTIDGITPPGGGTFPHLARSYFDDNDIFAADGASVYRSTNRGASWTTETTPAGSRLLTTCPSNSSRIYSSNGTTLYRSDDSGDNWVTISINPGYPTGVKITDLEPRPSNSAYVWASFGGYEAGKKVYFSDNSGADWVNMSGSLPNVACHSIAVDMNNTVYVGTDFGVFVRPLGESDWQPYLNNLPKTPVSELMVNNSAGTIIACTFGRGNWIDDIYEVCPTTGTLSVSGTLSGNRFYESNAIISSATVSGGEGTNVLMKAIDNVILSEGFEAKSGNVFKAYLGPCGSGGVEFRVSNLNDTLDMQRAFIAAEDGIRWPNAHFKGLNNNTAEISVRTAGNYTLRLARADGSVAAILSTGLALTAGDHHFNIPDHSPVIAGFYYLQLFKDGKMVHFHEYLKR